MIIPTPDPAWSFTGRDGSPSDALVVKETWEENVYRITAADLDDTGILLDVGANIGAVSAWAVHLGGTAVAVEPDPDNLILLRLNLLASEDPVGPAPYTVLPLAVSDRPGTVHLEPGHGHSRVVDAATASTVEVEAVTLDEVYHRAGITACDVLKIDVEGLEYAIFAATPPEVLRRARYLTLEFDAAPLDVFGGLVAKIACDFAVQIIGSPRRGGYLYARRYDDA